MKEVRSVFQKLTQFFTVTGYKNVPLHFELKNILRDNKPSTNAELGGLSTHVEQNHTAQTYGKNMAI